MPNEEELSGPEGQVEGNSPADPEHMDSDAGESGESTATSPEMAVFESFPDREQAAPALRILDECGIPYQLEESKMGFDPSFANNVIYQAWVLKVPGDRMEEARQEIESALEQGEVQLPADHYLRDFTEDELLEVIRKADEWSELDVVMARQMLAEKGAGLSDESLEQLRRERRAELAQPSDAGTGMIGAGYFLALAGGLFGLILGWVLKNSTKTTAYGDKVPNYDEASRAHGGRILILGALVLVVTAAWFVLKPLFPGS